MQVRGTRARRSRRLAPRLAAVVLLAGGITAAVAKPGAGASLPPTAVLTATSTKDDINKIKHVVVIMQENRSFDQYFGMYPGVDGFTLDTNGQPTNCVPDPRHGGCQVVYHDATAVQSGGPHGPSSSRPDVDNGLMDGFHAAWQKDCPAVAPNVPGQCGGSKPVPDVLSYKTRADIPNYWAYADNYVLLDHMFAPAASWSLPEHLYMVSAWSARCYQPGNPMSCENDASMPENKVAPGGGPVSYAWTDVTHLLNQVSVPWAYYLFDGTEPDCTNPDAVTCIPVPQAAKTGSIWNPLPHFDDVAANGQTGNVQSIQNLVGAAQAGALPAVSWVVPSQPVSEHPPASVADGQTYVTYMIDQLMQSPDWSSTAIFLSWDDWGGFYDNAVPPTVDANGDGIRVPMLVISPYARQGFVDHTTYSFDSMLKFIEDRFVGSQRLDASTDGRPDPRPTVRENAPTAGDLRGAFDFTQAPRPPLILPTVKSGAQLAQPMPAIPKVARPAASAATPISGSAPFTVRFSGAQSSDPDDGISSWKLTFGDGTSTSGTGAPPASLEHTYQTAGTDQAVLTVRDPSGNQSSASQQITVAGRQPTAWIWGTPASAFTAADVKFDAAQSESGDWTIDFGDGSAPVSGSGVPPRALRHTFSAPGLYTTVLTVTDTHGFSSTARAATLISAVRAPSIVAKGAKKVSASSALARAVIYPNGAATTAYIEYGTTKSFGSQTGSQSMGTTNPRNLGRSITGLLPNTKYFYRAVATSSAGTVRGQTRDFTTKAS